MSTIRKPLSDRELLLRMLCMSEHDFALDRMKIELEPAKYFWHAVCVQARARGETPEQDVLDWALHQRMLYGVRP